MRYALSSILTIGCMAMVGCAGASSDADVTVSPTLSGDTLVAAAVGARVGANGDQGAAYVFSRNQGGANNWGEVVKLTVPDGAVGDGFGRTVALLPKTSAAGRPFTVTAMSVAAISPGNSTLKSNLAPARISARVSG